MTEITAGDHGERVARVEGAVEQINATLQQLSARFDSLEKRINWLIGFQFTTLVTLGTLILLKL